jgi:hypothetical protein
MSESLNALFDTVELVRHPVRGMLERVPLDQLQLAPNHRKAIDPEGIHRLAHMLASTGQLTPCIGRRVADDRVMLYAGGVGCWPPAPAANSPAARTSRASPPSPA